MIRAIIAGGAGEIGSAIVRRFVASGAYVHVIDTDSERGELIAKSSPSRIRFHQANVCDVDALTALCTSLRDADVRVDALVTLAGGALPREFRGFEHGTPELFRQSVELNLLSHMYVIHAFLPLLKSTGGVASSITIVSSINAILDFGLPAYSSAKAGLAALARCLASEFGRYPIRCNVLLPGTVGAGKFQVEPKDIDEYKTGTVMNRFASAEEVASATWSVATEFTAMTGQQIVLDCGQTIRGRYRNDWKK